MKVDTKHAEYIEVLWTRARDTYAGEDVVKGRGALYLPPLGAHQEGSGTGYGDRYQMYVKRASFYNAVGRTVDGLAGAALRADPQLEVPSNVEDDLRDVTLKNQPIELAAQLTTREILTTGRQGLLVDVNDAGRPYWAFWKAEDIVNWRVEFIDGNPVLTMVVLHQKETKPSADDIFVLESKSIYRVLTLTNGVYASTIWREDEKGNWVPEEPVMPQRRGAALDFIPFIFIGPTGTTSEVEKPPLLDLINVNLSHYMNSADLEHGLHFVGVPQIVIMGAPQTGNDPMEFGSSVVWVLDQGADAKILQADGETMGALERAMERKRKLMATLGARLLEDQPESQETATAVVTRHTGDHATLGTIVNAVEQAYTRAVQIHSWWAMGETATTPDDIEASVELSKDFTAVRLTAQEIISLFTLLQGEAISFDTFWMRLTQGQWGRPVTAEEELKTIEEATETAAYTPDPPPPALDPNAELDENGQPIPPDPDEEDE